MPCVKAGDSLSQRRWRELEATFAGGAMPAAMDAIAFMT
jgi:hypothetical protein